MTERCEQSREEHSDKKVPNKTHNVIVLMAIQVDFRIDFVASFALVRLLFVSKLSPPCDELWIHWRENGWIEVDGDWLSDWNESENQEFDKPNGIVYSSFTVFTQAKLILLPPATLTTAFTVTIVIIIISTSIPENGEKRNSNNQTKYKHLVNPLAHKCVYHTQTRIRCIHTVQILSYKHKHTIILCVLQLANASSMLLIIMLNMYCIFVYIYVICALYTLYSMDVCLVYDTLHRCAMWCTWVCVHIHCIVVKCRWCVCLYCVPMRIVCFCKTECSRPMSFIWYIEWKCLYDTVAETDYLMP